MGIGRKLDILLRINKPLFTYNFYIIIGTILNSDFLLSELSFF